MCVRVTWLWLHCYRSSSYTTQYTLHSTRTDKITKLHHSTVSRNCRCRVEKHFMVKNDRLHVGTCGLPVATTCTCSLKWKFLWPQHFLRPCAWPCNVPELSCGLCWPTCQRCTHATRLSHNIWCMDADVSRKYICSCAAPKAQHVLANIKISEMQIQWFNWLHAYPQPENFGK